MTIYERFKITTGTACLLVAVSIAALTTTSPAFAGFEWTPPPKKEMPPVMAAPAPAVEEEVLLDGLMPPPGAVEDIAVETGNEAIRPSTAQTPSARQNLPRAFMPGTSSATSEPVMAEAISPPRPAEERAFEDAMGFGSDIPLVMAMQQIVPPEFSYSFDTGVNPGIRVAWSGGKPWNIVLEEAVAPFDLTAHVVGQTVLIQQDDGQYAPPLQDMETLMPQYQTSPVMPVDQAASVPSEPMPVPLAPTVPFETAPRPQYEPDPVTQQSYPRRVPPEIDRPMMHDGVPEPGSAEENKYMPTSLVSKMFGTNPPPHDSGADARPAPFPATTPLVAPASVSPPSEAPQTDPAADGPVMDPFEIQFWHAEQGDSLKDVLNAWSSRAGVAMLWNTPNDYVLSMPVKMHGTFPDAVSQLLARYNTADPRPHGKLHPNLPTGPSVLVVENYSSATN